MLKNRNLKFGICLCFESSIQNGITKLCLYTQACTLPVFYGLYTHTWASVRSTFIQLYFLSCCIWYGMVFVVALTIALLYTKSARSTMFCVKSNRWYVRVPFHILRNEFIISTNTEMAVSLLHALFRSEFVRPKFAF